MCTNFHKQTNKRLDAEETVNQCTRGTAMAKSWHTHKILNRKSLHHPIFQKRTFLADDISFFSHAWHLISSWDWFLFILTWENENKIVFLYWIAEIYKWNAVWFIFRSVCTNALSFLKIWFQLICERNILKIRLSSLSKRKRKCYIYSA